MGIVRTPEPSPAPWSYGAGPGHVKLIDADGKTVIAVSWDPAKGDRPRLKTNFAYVASCVNWRKAVERDDGEDG